MNIDRNLSPWLVRLGVGSGSLTPEAVATDSAACVIACGSSLSAVLSAWPLTSFVSSNAVNSMRFLEIGTPVLLGNGDWRLVPRGDFGGVLREIMGIMVNFAELRS